MYLNELDAAQQQLTAGLQLDARTADPASKAETSLEELLVDSHSALAIIAVRKAQAGTAGSSGPTSSTAPGEAVPAGSSSPQPAVALEAAASAAEAAAAEGAQGIASQDELLLQQAVLSVRRAEQAAEEEAAVHSQEEAILSRLLRNACWLLHDRLQASEPSGSGSSSSLVRITAAVIEAWKAVGYDVAGPSNSTACWRQQVRRHPRHARLCCTKLARAAGAAHSERHINPSAAAWL